MNLSANFNIFFLLIIIGADAQLINCPQNEMKFEKLIGIRPNRNEKGILLYRNQNNNAPVTLECISRCLNDTKCASFLLYYNSSECYSFSNSTIHTENFDYDSKPDNNIVWFRKTCLSGSLVPDQCQTKAWVIEILAGATLIGANTKKIKEIISRQQCIHLCMQERSFPCKSIKFQLIAKHIDATTVDPLGYCILSETDRHLTPTAFRVSRYEDEYIENQCVGISNSSEYCAYEEYENTSLEHVDVIVKNLTQPQCQHVCDTFDSFNCRGYSTVPLNINYFGSPLLEKFNCLLHSEDSKFIGPKLLMHNQRATYYERARCLNVSVTCSSSFMTITYKPEETFYGRIYTSGYSDVRPCYVEGSPNVDFLRMILPLNGSMCGISEAVSMEPWNRTLKSVLLVIQYNALIQTQSDRLIKVGCVYGNDDSLPVTLDTSVNITSSYPNRGSTVMNSSSVYPNVTMRVIDYNTKQTTNDTEIGQELQLVIEIKPGNGPYDIWAGNLIATSGNNTLQLLDESGCPTYLNLFPQFTKIQTNSSRMLISHFQAFKFFSNPVVRFSVMVHFCVLDCPPIECMDEYSNRLKRNTEKNLRYQLTSDVINATVYKINSRKNMDNENEELIEEMPLDTVLFVRGANISPDQLVYGENNRILVAGYDYVTNEVCVDYNLFIGLLVTWVLLQLVIVVCCFLLIRKYKKYFHIAYTRQLDDMHQNFGFGVGRRVHWADQ